MKGPLEGVTVLDLSFYLAGPYGGHILADLGARVIKVEPPGTGDPSRRGTGLEEGSLPNPQFIAIQRNKESVVLDLKSEEGLEALYDLVRNVDVLIENYRPGVTRRLKIDYETLREINPGIIHCTITGFGSDGPLAQKPAFDYIIQALGGAMTLTGGPEGRPVLMGIFMGDLAAPCMAAVAAVSALYRKRETGVGTHIDVSMLESLLYLAPGQTQDYLLTGDSFRTARGGLTAVGRVLEASDGGYVEVHCPFPKFQESLRIVVGSVPGFDALLDDSRFGADNRQDNIEAYWDLIERAFRTRPRDEWVRVLEAEDIPCGAANTIGEALELSQVRHRQMIAEVEIPAIGPVKTFASPFRFADIARPTFTPPPYLGQHTEKVLSEVAGYSDERIQSLRVHRAFGAPGLTTDSQGSGDAKA